jgi:hypothetical protein
MGRFHRLDAWLEMFYLPDEDRWEAAISGGAVDVHRTDVDSATVNVTCDCGRRSCFNIHRLIDYAERLLSGPGRRPSFLALGAAETALRAPHRSHP